MTTPLYAFYSLYGVNILRDGVGAIRCVLCHETDSDFRKEGGEDKMVICAAQVCPC